jgi:hypothetical protein
MLYAVRSSASAASASASTTTICNWICNNTNTLTQPPSIHASHQPPLYKASPSPRINFAPPLHFELKNKRALFPGGLFPHGTFFGDHETFRKWVYFALGARICFVRFGGNFKKPKSLPFPPKKYIKLNVLIHFRGKNELFWKLSGWKTCPQ